MHISGDFTVLGKNESKSGKQFYQLGDVKTFSTISLPLAGDLEVGKTYKLEFDVAIKSGKFGTYFELKS